MPPVTKTLGPLHLEDLEPHRFEDLIRQLLYDFRPWRDLEATGRTGSDEGFDARAWEIIGGEQNVDTADLEDGSPPAAETRQWLIQCKRERSIGPKKIQGYLDALPTAAGAGLYGLIFAAASDFSIATRDAFFVRARELGFQEIKLWGKAEIEDQLYQPKNDHLLFGYFGVSLQIRRRSVKAEIRSRLAMKRKAKRDLQPFSSVLVRDATDDRYPYLDPDERLGRPARGRWRAYRFEACGPFGIELIFRRHMVFIDSDNEHWDFAERSDDSRPHDDPWPDPDKPDESSFRTKDYQIWSELPDEKKAWLQLNLVLPYESIIDIDSEGDEFFRGPHIYVGAFNPVGNGPFANFKRFDLSTIGSWPRSCSNDEKNRVKIFERMSDR